MMKRYALLFFWSIIFISNPASGKTCLPDDSPDNTCTAKNLTLTEQLVSGPPSCIEGKKIPCTISLHSTWGLLFLSALMGILAVIKLNK